MSLKLLYDDNSSALLQRALPGLAKQNAWIPKLLSATCSHHPAQHCIATLAEITQIQPLLSGLSDLLTAKNMPCRLPNLLGLRAMLQEHRKAAQGAVLCELRAGAWHHSEPAAGVYQVSLAVFALPVENCLQRNKLWAQGREEDVHRSVCVRVKSSLPI